MNSSLPLQGVAVASLFFLTLRSRWLRLQRTNGLRNTASGSRAAPKRHCTCLQSQSKTNRHQLLFPSITQIVFRGSLFDNAIAQRFVLLFSTSQRPFFFWKVSHIAHHFLLRTSSTKQISINISSLSLLNFLSLQFVGFKLIQLNNPLFVLGTFM